MVRAADPALDAPAPAASAAGPLTLIGDWFGKGLALREAGFDLGLEWSQFYQGMTSGDGDKSWRYGGKIDGQSRVDLSKLGLWNGFGVTAQGHFNYGHTINGIGGTLAPVNTGLLAGGLYIPAIPRAGREQSRARLGGVRGNRQRRRQP
jgi:hypothetical protein